ncbi:DUF2020 domain-containing protein [Corynebacterium guaraldiae]|uniref:DUF2020 domain-containing protein n=1 Tax=unclassified Corynebacterium TaxID=2624378 RepID=UPI0008A5D146|nr:MULTISPECIES: DUF2020 domain-containing protein [unclassified Corynebacterium]MDK6806467.1 DUF2020 domain-containing protein [Corynebacterium aurimucosum]NJJ84130.1 DUF2020 domain-containing protein [Corynebacterium aurimucosum]OFK29150.1 hypothetical protein HMPREF2822_08995 [Corynebacterium sp. HMSC062E11]OFP70935.1 hypothetical protein HMPREF2974_12425 [Corynebacterium sp. HMSC078C09]
MRHSLLPPLAACLIGIGFAAVGCSDAADPAPSTEASSPASDTNSGDGLPMDATAEVSDWEDCPYLDTQWVADTNGQRMTRWGIDKRFSTPACVFWSYPEEPQVTVLARQMPSVDEARAVVDWAAPVEDTELAEFDGWSGGRGVFEDHTVFAVQKDNHAVVVWSNQLQTLKPQLIAQEAINRLGL